MNDVLLEVCNLKKYFPVNRGLVIRRQVGQVKAVDGVSFVVKQGETFGLVGESGCGKTTVSKMVLLLERPTGGSILFQGDDIQGFRGRTLLKYRVSVQALFQDATSSLDPRMRVRDIISEPVLIDRKLSGKEVGDRVADLLSKVGLDPSSASLYPHEFSGGQRQRLALARSLYVDPKIVVLDEPVSALDVSVQGQILNLLKDTQSRLGLTYLLIAHDLAVIRHMCDSIGVMYLGKLVETLTSEQLHANPVHPYTQSLLASILPYRPNREHQGIALTGEIPSPLNPPSGCRFHTRCFRAKPVCSESEPPLVEVEKGHMVACHPE